MEVFLQALVNGILLGGFYSLMGMGQNIIFGVMNIVNFCHGEMLMVGMYITYVLYTYFGVDPYVALPIVAVLMFGLGRADPVHSDHPFAQDQELYEPAVPHRRSGPAAHQRRSGHLWFHLL